MTDKVKTVKLYFHWTLAEVGLYKPVTLVPQSLNGSSLMVAVEVPAKLDYIENYDKLIIQEVTDTGNERPILTTKGMRFVIDTLQAALAPVKETVELDTDDNLEYIDE